MSLSIFYPPILSLTLHYPLHTHCTRKIHISPLIYKRLLSRAKECSVDQRLWLYRHYKCSCLHVNLRCDKKKDIKTTTSLVSTKSKSKNIRFSGGLQLELDNLTIIGTVSTNCWYLPSVCFLGFKIAIPVSWRKVPCYNEVGIDLKKTDVAG